MSRGRRWAALAASVCGLALVTATTPAAAERAKPGDGPVSVAKGAPAAADEAVRRVNRLAVEQQALGLYRDGGFVVLAPADKAIAAETFADTGFAVRVARSAHTRAEVDAVQKAVRERGWHKAAAKYSYGFYYDAKKDAVSLETDAPAEVVAPLLSAHRGAIAYQKVESGRDTRRNDPPAHWGGASITAGGATCSSAFSVQNGSGTRFMVTAGHCWAQGTTIFSPEGGWNWGTVVNRASFPVWDLELIGGSSYGSYVYRGDTTGYSAPMVGSGDPVIGYVGYCRSGQTTGEQCGSQATSLSAEFCDASGCTPGLISYTGGGLSSGGDSGGPYLVTSAGGPGMHARGVHIARTGSTMYAEKWSTVASYFGVTIVTS